MALRNVGIKPPLAVQPGDTVTFAVDRMLEGRRGSILIMENDRVVGIFTERDVLSRVIGPRLDPEQTLLADVMTKEVKTMHESAELEEALVFMVRHHFRHLPVVDDLSKPIGMLSIRSIFGYYVDNQHRILDGLVAYLGADGPGG